MSPTAKDLETSNAGTNPAGTRPAPGADDANKPQPVPLEVPVTVNGARTVEGSDKREPFSESTQTVLVFSNGAVIRLSSSVAAGQLLFLTNDKTKKEVVCQVVKSKNYRNVSGYVELEFTEPVAGFWGMRFPGERTAAPANTAAPVAARPASSVVASVVPVAPAAHKIEAPAPLPQRVEPKPAPRPAAPAAQLPVAAAPTQPVSQARPETLTASSLQVETKPSASALHSTPQIVPSLPKAPGLTDGWGSGMTSSAPPVSSSKIPQVPVAPKAPAPSVVPPPISHVAPPASHAAPPSSQVSVNSQPATPDALRRETDRLHEQLASMLLGTDAPKSVPATPVAQAHRPPTQELSSKVVEIAKPQSHTQKFNAPAKSAAESSLDQDEVKIPSWLEPLARNAASHAQNELTARDEEKHNDGVIEFEVQDLSVPTTATKDDAAAEADPVFETHFVDGQSDLAATGSSKKSNKGILIGAIAAGLVLAVAGGTWYSRRSSAEPAQVAAATSSPEAAPGAAAPAAVAPSAAQPSARSNDKAAPNRSNINSEPVPVAQTQAPTQQQNSQPSAPSTQMVKGVDKTVSAELSAYKRLAEPAPEPVKKPSLGEVHLAAPKSNRAAGGAVGETEALNLNSNEATPGGDAMSSGLGGSSKQPVAPAVPLPVGGDVTPARLIASTAPVYPTLAKAQHVEGAVRVDALIEANGRISAMKVMSGPLLLHQAAMDALRGWKYQPATLDGKAVSMHLTVTVQFRLQ
jgi:protein TonB